MAGPAFAARQLQAGMKSRDNFQNGLLRDNVIHRVNDVSREQI